VPVLTPAQKYDKVKPADFSAIAICAAISDPQLFQPRACAGQKENKLFVFGVWRSPPQ
jgi:hypothetical protein